MENASYINKRKRSQNTTSEQYLMYVEEMENDYIFRSGTIDPTVEPGYIDKKWEQLTLKLNSLGKGPALKKETWQKRFKDWKNATRAKYRKMNEHRLATGGGVAEKIELTHLEERGLEVWGKVAVTGTPLVTITGGINNYESCQQDLPSTSTEREVDDMIISEGEVLEEIIICNDGTEELDNEPTINQNIQEGTPKTSGPKSNYKKKSHKSLFTLNKLNLNEMAGELKQSYDANQKTLEDISNKIFSFSEIYKKVHTERNKLEELRLQFEVAKYKYENKDFTFKL